MTYNPQIGRFTTLDPYAGDPQTPQSLHKYLYAHADPIHNVDPSGEMSISELLVAGTIAAGAAALFIGGLIATVNDSAGYNLDGWDITDPQKKYRSIVIREAQKNSIEPALLAAVLDAELSDISAGDRYFDFAGSIAAPLTGRDTTIGIGQHSVGTIHTLRPGHSRLGAIMLARNPENSIALTAEYLGHLRQNVKSLAIASSQGQITQGNVNNVILRHQLEHIRLDDFRRPMAQWTPAMIEVIGYNYTQTPWVLVKLGGTENEFRLGQFYSQTGAYGEYVRERYELFKPTFLIP